MNTRTTFFLAVIALGIMVYLVTSGIDTPGTEELNLRSQKIFNLKSDSIGRLELTNPDGNYVFAKTGSGKWMIETPVAYPADDNAISSLISELEFARRTATLDDRELGDREKSLALFGLKPAKVKLKIREQDKNRELILGSETARPGTVYALVGGDGEEHVAVVEKSLEAMLARGLDEWRSRKIFDFLTSDVTSLTLRKDEAESEVVKEGGLWKISKPLMTSADENEVAAFLANLSSAIASGFVADNAADIGAYGLSSPSLVLDINRGPQKDSIRVGSEMPGEKGFYYAQLSSRPTVFKINDGMYQLMAGMMDRLRDKRIFSPAASDSVQKLKIEKGDLVLEMSAGPEASSEWKIPGSGGRTVDQEKMKAFLDALKAVRATSFQPLSDEARKKTGLNKPAWKAVFEIKEAKGENQEKVLQFSAAKKGEVYVETGYRSGIVTVPEAQIPPLPSAIHEWYGKILKPPFEGDPDFLKWDNGSQTSQLNKDKDGAWPKELDGKPIENTIFQKQLQILRGIRLREWTPTTDKTFGLPYFRLTYGKGEQKQILEFGKELENGWRLARVQGEPLAFAMSNEGYLLLRAIPTREASAASDPK